MGCGGSKLDPNEDEIPARLKPILQRRQDEIGARAGTKDSNARLKPILLGHEPTKSHESNHEEEEEEQNNNEEIASNNLDSSFHFTQDCPPTLQTIGVDFDNMKFTQDVDSNVNAHEIINKPLNRVKSLSQCGSDNKMDKRRSLRKRHVSEGSFVSITDGEIESDGYVQGDLGRCSPSFRVYCTEFSDEGSDILDGSIESVGDEDIVDDQRHSISQESSCSNEVSARHMPSKKGKRGRRFKITMPKGGKLYKNMQSFYNFPCSSQTNTHLLQKAAA